MSTPKKTDSINVSYILADRKTLADREYRRWLHW